MFPLIFLSELKLIILFYTCISSPLIWYMQLCWGYDKAYECEVISSWFCYPQVLLIARNTVSNTWCNISILRCFSADDNLFFWKKSFLFPNFWHTFTGSQLLSEIQQEIYGLCCCGLACLITVYFKQIILNINVLNQYL